ncbi:conserved Plasmodium protein, unknown function [Plasmodium gallinaceum]|uniref:Uncharacterized protein n=1 Tax=Plasmodium gallinaceum TaxID=5849 RepID=A0A1J1H2K5_PLAGA|nr:conserved Plasmodium protein, unknown function [Plasmodium gallinaceum]CRG97723.1 conserved Plasmodium protein, unknown function [Plasmodium gallinaceum]
MDQHKIKEDLSKEDQTKIYKILLLTYSRKLSKYQDQIKNIYFNNIISNIKDDVNDHTFNEHVASQHYFIDTLIKSNEHQEFLKTLQLLEKKVTTKENVVNEENGDINNSVSNTQTNNDIINNGQNENNQRNARTVFNNYIMEIMERSHIFLLIKILFVLFLFEANSKVYFIVSGMFILYNRGFFDFIINNFNFMSSNETIEQILRRMSESRNLNNSEVNYNNEENNNLNEIIEENNDQEDNHENHINNINSPLSDIEKDNEKRKDEKLNTENELLSLLNMGNNNGRISNREDDDNKWNNDHDIVFNESYEEFNKNNITDTKNIEKKSKRKDINLYENNNNSNEFNDNIYFNYNNNLENENKNNFYTFKKISEAYDNIESEITDNSYKTHTPSYKTLNLNKNKDGESKESKVDSHICYTNIKEKEEKEDIHNFVSEDIPYDSFNKIQDCNNDERRILESGIRRRKKKNKVNLNDSANSFNNLLNNSMGEFITSDYEDSADNSDTSESNVSNASSDKKKQLIQNKKNEQNSNRQISRRKPTKLEKYIYQSVVMFFMTLLPWWVPDVAYLEE